MITISLLSILAAVAIGLTVQLRWALANYPMDRKWWILRLSTSFLQGMVIGLVISGNPFTGNNRWWFPLFVGTMTCLIFTFLFPGNLKHVIPPNDER